MSAADFYVRNGCRVVHFMQHDRTAFGGALVAIGILYLWLVTFPLREGESWAWWTLALPAASIRAATPAGSRSSGGAGLRELPRIPRLWLSRHVARSGHAGASPAEISHLAPAYLGAAICAAGLARFHHVCCLTGSNRGG